MKLSAGTLLQGGKYRIEEHLGSGGFGCTYKAYYRTMRCYVAIKEFFVKDFCNREENGTVKVATQSKMELVERLRDKFLNEARTLFNTKMHHPNIVRVTDVFEENGTVYYAMDYIEGSSLAGLIAQKGCLSESEALGYIKQIAAALKHLHANNCLHLDIKPANIMIDADGKATLIDFGVSKQYDEVNGENTSTLLGHTPGYAPIEQSGRGMIKFNAACDIYALGATLYKALTGTTPVDATLRAGDKSLCNLSYPEHVSPAMRNVIDKSMQISRSDRPQSVEEFIELVESGEMKDESEKMKDERAKSKDAICIFGNASSDGSSAASQDVMPLGSQKASVAKVESEETEIASGAANLSMGTGKNASNGNAAVEENEIAVEVVETPPVAPEPAPRPQPEENQKKNKWLWIIILLAIICGAAVGFMLLGGGSDDAVVKDKEITVAENTINGHEYVDLGLSVKWATCNVGASKPEEYGNHYAWGETSTKSSYTKDNSVTYGKNFSDIGGDPQYDVARKQWGSTWRLPTKAEFEELRSNCTWTWTKQKGVNGYKVTSKKNGNSIFLPAAGWRLGTSLNGQGTLGNYWSSTPHESNSNYAYYLLFYSGGHGTNWLDRLGGLSVRPVSGGIENKTEKMSNAKPESNKLSTRTFKANGVEFIMVAVEGGTFSMGSNDGGSDEEPIHQVTLDSYCIGQTEVTQALWQAVMGSNPSYFKGTSNPVESVGYFDCIDFINQLNTLLKDQLPQGRKFRLPTEAEWEYAARGGNKSKGYEYSGSNSISTVAWYEGNSVSRTHPVKQKASNELGLYDMSGNVREWCSDWYGSNYYSYSPQNNPKGPGSGSLLVLRGGSWGALEQFCRSAFRDGSDPGRSYACGLRLAF